MKVLKYLQLPFHFEVKKLQNEIANLTTQPWQEHYQKKHYEGNWSAIPLRSINGLADNIIISPEENAEYADTPFLKQCPYIQEVLSNFNCALLAVRLLKLDAGAIIKEHRDAELNFEKGEIRIHIPIITHELVEFSLDKERIKMKEGECWYLNLNLPHSIKNNSPINRIHLVIDAKVNNYITQLFSQVGLLKKEIEYTQHNTQSVLQMIKELRTLNTDTALKLANDMEASLTL